MAKIEQVRMTLSVQQRPWFRAAFEVLCWGCLVVSLVSIHAANWLSERGCGFLTRHGMKFATNPLGDA